MPRADRGNEHQAPTVACNRNGPLQDILSLLLMPYKSNCPEAYKKSKCGKNNGGGQIPHGSQRSVDTKKN